MLNDVLDELGVHEGDLLVGKYRVERILGQGGMGVVIAATHVELDQPVAIKMLLPTLLSNEGAVERFLREARSAVRLRSEHAAKVLDVGRTELGLPYMAMELLDGSDLGVVLEHRGVLTVEEAADFVLQAIEAVAEAHSYGIVHRDLKPQNLFVIRGLGGHPLVKVLDFGISKTITSLGNLTQTSSVLGSPMYMAPEQLRSAKLVDARSDIWALGVVLRELLTGKLPFEAETLSELTLMVAGDAPRPVHDDRPDLPFEVVDIIDRCLQKNPADRFQTVGELANALQEFAPPETRGIAARANAMLMASALAGGATLVDTEGRASRVSLTPASRLSAPPRSMAASPGVSISSDRTHLAIGGSIEHERRTNRLPWIVASIAVVIAIGAPLIMTYKARTSNEPIAAGTTGLLSAPAQPDVTPVVTPIVTPTVTGTPSSVASSADGVAPLVPPSASASASAKTTRTPAAGSSKSKPVVPKPGGDDLPSSR